MHASSGLYIFPFKYPLAVFWWCQGGRGLAQAYDPGRVMSGVIVMQGVLMGRDLGVASSQLPRGAIIIINFFSTFLSPFEKDQKGMKHSVLLLHSLITSFLSTISLL
ncbi:hypothetical protein BDQ17DRAFT_1330733 [Cyathus striatus]|nr:hypothetical protein BDQ17DRAFT_1330733 [Cyathus striatus]